MTKRKKTGGKDFKPGQSGNPKGRPALPPELREIKTFSNQEVERIFAKYMRLDIVDLEELEEKRDIPMIDMMIIRVICSAARRADHTKFDFVLNRTIGKVKDKIEISKDDDAIRSESEILEEIKDINSKMKELKKLSE